MDEPMKSIKIFTQSLGELIDFVLTLDITNIDGSRAQQFGNLLLPLATAHDVHNFSADFSQHLTYAVSHTFSIGHTEHQHALACQLQEIHETDLFLFFKRGVSDLRPGNGASEVEPRGQLAVAGHFAGHEESG